VLHALLSSLEVAISLTEASPTVTGESKIKDLSVLVLYHPFQQLLAARALVKVKD